MYEKLKEFLTDDFWIMPATPKYIDKGIPYITSKNIKNGKIDYSNINYISKEDYENISKNRPIKVNDILISMIGTIGETAVVTESDGEFYGQNMFLVRLNDKKMDQRFFLNYFKCSFVKNQLFNKRNKSTQSYLKANHIEDLKVPFFTIEEQVKIADKLDKIQMMINEKKEQISLLNQLIKSQFVEMFGDPIINEKGWNKITNTHLCSKIGSGATPKGGNSVYLDNGITFIRSMNIYDNLFVHNDLAYLNDKMAEDLKNVIVEENDILLNITGASVCRACIVPKELLPARVNQHVSILRYKECNQSFILHQIINDSFKDNLYKISKNGGATREALTKSQLENLELIIPPIELQNKFAKIVEQIDKQKFEFEKSLKNLEELQSSLMQEYFG